MTTRVFALIAAIAIVADATSADAGLVSTRHAAVVNCGPYRHAVVHRSWSDGRRIDRVVCVANARRTRVVRRRQVYHRSWKKSAAVIGGATAAGSGVGALVGGKKGALIGGAAGAGAGTAYEVHKRRRRRR